MSIQDVRYDNIMRRLDEIKRDVGSLHGRVKKLEDVEVPRSAPITHTNPAPKSVWKRYIVTVTAHPDVCDLPFSSIVFTTTQSGKNLAKNVAAFRAMNEIEEHFNRELLGTLKAHIEEVISED